MTSYVGRTKSDHSPKWLVDTFLFLPHMTSYCVSITEQTTGKCNLFVKFSHAWDELVLNHANSKNIIG